MAFRKCASLVLSRLEAYDFDTPQLDAAFKECGVLMLVRAQLLKVQSRCEVLDI